MYASGTGLCPTHKALQYSTTYVVLYWRAFRLVWPVTMYGSRHGYPDLNMRLGTHVGILSPGMYITKYIAQYAIPYRENPY